MGRMEAGLASVHLVALFRCTWDCCTLDGLGVVKVVDFSAKHCWPEEGYCNFYFDDYLHS